ncbi:MAG: ABC-F family ATP-binding cassette domain-containing protein, partial [Bacteroidota bacterium]|nr:ABC-F family ATP-binding cassette domain-containing protein [Bacteroidota bacterium]
MNLLQIIELTKSYGEKILFEKINFGINQGQKIAFIAKNGSGKTSLLNIITEKDIPDEGEVTKHKDLKISYLEQNPYLDESKTISEVIYDSDNKYIQLIKSYQDQIIIAQENNTESNTNKLQELVEKMDKANAWTFESQIKEILNKFKIIDLSQSVSTLSGGQKKKIALAKVLISDSNLLILDEPTNHLDIEMIKWLEDFLAKQKLAILLVSHDRYFLDSVCDTIYELEQDNIYKYSGNYKYFLEKRAERIQNQITEAEKAQNLLRKETEWIRRMPKARTTKSKSRIDSYYKLKDKAYQKIENDDTPEFKVEMSRVGKKILELKRVSKKYDSINIVEDFTYTFMKGEHIGIIGPNGIGKSTLLNMIIGKENPDKGEITRGETITFGYYSQDGLKVDAKKRVIDIVKDKTSAVKYGDGTIGITQFLSYFNFDHNTQYNYFENLSGGEKRRLFLILTLLDNPNFLILDEPTNDLDIYTINVLEEFLLQYKGCVLIVSHDRFFMDTLSDHVFAFEGDGEIKDYPGNYSQYEQWKAEKEASAKKIVKKEKKENSTQKKQNTQPTNKPTFKEKREFEEVENIIAA